MHGPGYPFDRGLFVVAAVYDVADQDELSGVLNDRNTFH